MRSLISAAAALALAAALPVFLDKDHGAIVLLAGTTASAILVVTSPQVRRWTRVVIVPKDEWARVNRLAEQQEGKKDWEGGLRELGRLRGIGIHLRDQGDRHFGNKGEEEAWIAETDRWADETARVIDVLSPADAGLFRVIDNLRFPHKVYGGRGEAHNTSMTVIEERVGLLTEFMERNKHQER